MLGLHGILVAPRQGQARVDRVSRWGRNQVIAQPRSPLPQIPLHEQVADGVRMLALRLAASLSRWLSSSLPTYNMGTITPLA